MKCWLFVPGKSSLTVTAQLVDWLPSPFTDLDLVLEELEELAASNLYLYPSSCPLPPAGL